MTPPLTLEALATARGLPPDALKRLGWREAPDGVAVPWPGGATHVRHTLDREEGRPRWTWRDKALATGPYGHDRLPAVVAELVVTESEADAVALWSARVAAVATGGAKSWRPEWWRTLPPTVRRVVVWAEDAGSAPLAAAVLASRAEDGPEVLVSSPLWCGAEKDPGRILAARNGSGAAVLREVVDSARPARAVHEAELADAVVTELGGRWGTGTTSASARCPFHGDRAPSLSIYRDAKEGSAEWFFTCHGGSCGLSGPLVTLALALGLVPIPKQQFVSAAYRDGGAAETNPGLEQKFYSAAYKHVPAAETNSPAATPLPFRSPAEVVAAGGRGPDWLWEGYIAAGSITVLGGREKRGKSTLAWRLVAAKVLGEEAFLGQPVRPGPVVVLSEEADGTLSEKLRTLGLEDAGDRLRILSRTAVGGRPDWGASVRAALQEAQRIGARLLAIDTLAFWAQLPADTENHAGAVQAAFAPLFDAAAAGLAVLVLHHVAKATGELRGSTALGASADIIMVLAQEGDGTRRKLTAVGRYSGTPEALLLDWDGRDYTALGTPAAVSAAARRETILAALPDTPPGLTSDDVAAATGIPAQRVRELLLELANADWAVRTGSGTRGDPYRYCRVPENPDPEKGGDFLPLPDGRNGRNLAHDSSPNLPKSFLPPGDTDRAAETNSENRAAEPDPPPTGTAPCPQCGRPLERGTTCWTCRDRRCRGCGAWTGSPLRALCYPCGAKEEPP